MFGELPVFRRTSLRHYRALGFYTVLIISLCRAQDTRPTVAVLDFEGRGISSNEVYTLTERLRTEINNTGAVRLIERKALEKIFEEQGLQQAGCTTDECAAEVGALLGVQLMINGSIGKLGSSYTIDAKMFSVETGATERTKSTTYQGEIEGLLTEIEILAWEIVGLEAPQRLLLKKTMATGREAALPTVAVLDFEGRGIAVMEAQTLTDRFSTELGQTGAVRLVERRTMNEVLEEQGFAGEGCTSDECAAEVGALLGVQYMIAGAIGKVGNTFTIDAKMFSVASGAAERTKSLTYTGAVDGLITEIEILAWNIVDKKVPRKLLSKRRAGVQVAGDQPVRERTKSRFGALVRSTFIPGLGQFYSDRNRWGTLWITSELTVAGLIYASYTTYQAAHDDYLQFQADYDQATDTDQIAEYKARARASYDEMTAANDQIELLVYSGAGLWALNMLHAVIFGPKRSDQQAASESSVRLAYDSELQQPQLSLTFRF